MSKHLVIEKEIHTCAQCYHIEHYVCFHPNRGTNGSDVTGDNIPEWCPLPETPEKSFSQQCNNCKQLNRPCPTFIMIEQHCFDTGIDLDDIICTVYFPKGV